MLCNVLKSSESSYYLGIFLLGSMGSFGPTPELRLAFTDLGIEGEEENTLRIPDKPKEAKS